MNEAFRELTVRVEQAVAGAQYDKSELARLLDRIDPVDIGEPEERAHLAILLDTLGLKEQVTLVLRATADQSGQDAHLPNLAGILASGHSEYERARELFGQALSAVEEGSSLKAKVMANLAALNLLAGEVGEASIWLNIASNSCAQFGDTATDVLLASTEFGIARSRDNVPGLRKSVSRLNYVTRERVTELGSDHPLALTAVASLAAAEFELASSEQSAENQERAIAVLEIVAHRLAADLGADHLYALTCLENLCVADLRLSLARGAVDRAQQAASALESVSQRMKAAIGSNHPQTRTAAANSLAAQTATIADLKTRIAVTADIVHAGHKPSVEAAEVKRHEIAGDPQQLGRRYTYDNARLRSVQEAAVAALDTDRPASSRSWPESSLLGGLAPPARDILLSAGGPVRYEPGRVLMREADRTAFVLVLLQGMVKATSASRDGLDVLLAVRMGGDLIGEFSAVDDLPRSATVTACGPVVARLLNRHEFLECMRRDPRIAQAVTASVVSQLRTANSYRVDFTGCDAATRVARVLCQFARTYGHQVRDSTLIDWPITQLELASLCSAAEPTVHKALRALRKAGVISTGYRSIRIENFAELRRIAFE